MGDWHAAPWCPHNKDRQRHEALCDACKDGRHADCEATLSEREYDEGVCCCNLSEPLAGGS